MNEEKKEVAYTSDEGGVSIREVCRIIGKKIWFILAGSVLAAIAAVLIFMFAINPAKQSSSMSFRVDYPFSTERKYPDGSMFDYGDIVNQRGVIEKAKENSKYKDEFASINVDNVVQNGGLSISAYRTSEAANAPYVYTVTMKSSCFPKNVVPEHFIEALTEAFTLYMAEKANSLSYNLDPEIFKSASFKDQLALLEEQKEILKSQYDTWIRSYSTGHVVNGKSLGVYRTKVVTTLADNVKVPIENDLSLKGFEHFNSLVTKDDIKTRIEQLQVELKLDRAIIDELGDVSVSGPEAGGYSAESYSIATHDDNSETSSGGNNTIIITPSESNLSQRAAYYKERYAIGKQQMVYLTGDALADENSDISGYDYTKMVDEIKTFGEKLQNQYRELDIEAETLRSVISAIYLRDTVVTFESRNANSAGGTSIVIVAVAVFVVAFLILAIIAYYVGKKGAKAKKNEPASEEPLEGAEDSEKKE